MKIIEANVVKCLDGLYHGQACAYTVSWNGKTTLGGEQEFTLQRTIGIKGTVAATVRVTNGVPKVESINGHPCP